MSELDRRSGFFHKGVRGEIVPGNELKVLDLGPETPDEYASRYEAAGHAPGVLVARREAPRDDLEAIIDVTDEEGPLHAPACIDEGRGYN